MIGLEEKKPISFVETERAPTKKELQLWDRAQTIAKRVNLRSYALKLQWKQIVLTHNFSKANELSLNEPELPDLADRMFEVLHEIESLKNLMFGVESLEMGVRLSADGEDLDIVEPNEKGFGWVLPAVIGAVIVVGIIVRWAHLEEEVSILSAKYNGVITRSDMALCANPDSDMCHDWEKSKASGDYYHRETLIDEVKNAVSTVGKVAKKGLGAGLALAIPLLLWMYLPRGRKD